MATHRQLAALRRARSARRQYTNARHLIGAGMLMHKMMRRRGGFDPITAYATAQAAHSALQAVKPVSRVFGIANELGISKPINNFLGKSKFGRALKSAGSFLTGKLGYGRRRRHRRGSGRRRHYRRRY